MSADLPKHWTVYEGTRAGSSVDVVREFNLIDGGGKRMASRREGGTGRPKTKNTRPAQPRARMDRLERRVDTLEEDIRSIKQDVREMKGQLDRIIEVLAGDK